MIYKLKIDNTNTVIINSGNIPRIGEKVHMHTDRNRYDELEVIDVIHPVTKGYQPVLDADYPLVIARNRSDEK